jgi:hypothetical protein
VDGSARRRSTPPLPGCEVCWGGSITSREGLTIGHRRSSLSRTPIVYALPVLPANVITSSIAGCAIRWRISCPNAIHRHVCGDTVSADAG